MCASYRVIGFFPIQKDRKKKKEIADEFPFIYHGGIHIPQECVCMYVFGWFFVPYSVKSDTK